MRATRGFTMKASKCTTITAMLGLGLALGGAECFPDDRELDQAEIDREAEIERFADALANWYERCLPQMNGFVYEVEPALSPRLADTTEIREGLTASFQQLDDNPHVTMSRAALVACTEYVESSSCVDGFADPGPCETVWVGTLTEGAACAIAEECAGEASCFGLSDTSCGVCKPLAGPGESCVERGCVSHHYCDDDNRCVESININASPTYTPGQSCQTDGEGCNWYRSGLACLDEDDDGVGVCTEIEIVEEGGICDLPTVNRWTRICRHGLVSTHYCDVEIAAGATQGTCRRRPSVGEPCEPTFGHCNGLEAFCNDADQCEALTPVGGECDPETYPHTCGLDATCDAETMVCVEDSVAPSEPPALVCE